MKDRGREQDDGAALEELFASFPFTSSFTLGFLAAVRSGPDAVATSTWLAELGVAETDATKADLLVRLSGAVAETLRTDPATTAPSEGDPDAEASDFCRGYVRGARLHATWQADATASAELAPLEALADDAAAREHRARVAPLVAELHAYWKAKRQVVGAATKVGRNDPCPCGSGKKHKKCCLAGASA